MKVRLKEAAREKKNWSLYKLANVLELPQQTVYSWASGRTQPGWESMDILCTVLGCTLDDMFQPEEKAQYSEETLLKKQKMTAVAAVRSYKKMEFEMGG